MGFGRILAKPLEMKRFLLALDEIDLDILAQFSTVREFLKEHIKTEAFTGEGRKVIVQLIKDGVGPRITAYLFIRVLLEDLLLDGDYHVLRGKLTKNGENYLAIYNNVVRELRLLNWFSAAQAVEHFQAIRNGVETTFPAERRLKTSA